MGMIRAGVYIGGRDAIKEASALYCTWVVTLVNIEQRGLDTVQSQTSPEGKQTTSTHSHIYPNPPPPPRKNPSKSRNASPALSAPTKISHPLPSHPHETRLAVNGSRFAVRSHPLAWALFIARVAQAACENSAPGCRSGLGDRVPLLPSRDEAKRKRNREGQSLGKGALRLDRWAWGAI